MARATLQTAPKPRKRSKRGLEAEQKLLDAANTVFWAHGFAGCTIAQIIDASGLSVGSFYHQFNDKRELLDRGTENVVEDFRETFKKLDLSASANRSLFEMLHRLTLSGRALIARNRGFYRALSEIAQNQIDGFGPLRIIGPTVIAGVAAEIDGYSDQLSVPASRETVAHAVQLIIMCALQTELGMGPQFPSDEEEFANVIARAACGVLGYRASTELSYVAQPSGSVS